MKLSICFVCQRGQLELKACLLAASLVKNLGGDLQLHVAIPQPYQRYGVPSFDTLNFLKEIGANLIKIENNFTSDYPIGNKLFCLEVANTRTDAERIILLDSDMICLRELPANQNVFDGDVCLKPEVDHKIVSKYWKNRFGGELPELVEADWKKCYSEFNLEIPQRRIKSTYTGENLFPYFNAGFICLKRETEFPATWIRVASRLAAVIDPEKYLYLDQFSLPIALHISGMKLQIMDDNFNYPVDVKNILPDNPPAFVHYHQPNILFNDPVCAGTVENVMIEFPNLRKIMTSNKTWSEHLSKLSL